MGRHGHAAAVIFEGAVDAAMVDAAAAAVVCAFRGAARCVAAADCAATGVVARVLAGELAVETLSPVVSILLLPFAVSVACAHQR